MRTLTLKEAYKVKVGYSIQVLDNNDIVRCGMVTEIINKIVFGVWLFKEKRSDTFPLQSIIQVGNEVKPTFK